MIHDKYADLQDAMAEFPNGFAAAAEATINAIMDRDNAFRIAKENKLILAGDDRAERVVEALAVALISSNPGLEAEVALTKQRQAQRDREAMEA